MAKDAKQNLKRSKGGRGANEKQKPHTRRGDKESYKPGRTTHHQDSKATAMILKATSLIVATINKLTYSFTLCSYEM